VWYKSSGSGSGSCQLLYIPVVWFTGAPKAALVLLHIGVWGSAGADGYLLFVLVWLAIFGWRASIKLSCRFGLALEWTSHHVYQIRAIGWLLSGFCIAQLNGTAVSQWSVCTRQYIEGLWYFSGRNVEELMEARNMLCDVRSAVVPSNGQTRVWGYDCE
jgi:hypothetical protein